MAFSGPSPARSSEAVHAVAGAGAFSLRSLVRRCASGCHACRRAWASRSMADPRAAVPGATCPSRLSSGLRPSRRNVGGDLRLLLGPNSCSGGSSRRMLTGRSFTTRNSRRVLGLKRQELCPAHACGRARRAPCAGATTARESVRPHCRTACQSFVAHLRFCRGAERSRHTLTPER
jgi:hypothetical protein